MTLTIRAGLLAGSALVAAPAAAEDVLSAVHAFPASLVYSQSFLEFVDKVNERGEGVVRIDVRGGPEAIGMFQQPEAVRNGVVDMVQTPGSFYGGIVPEKDALVATNIAAPEARENGGIALIDEIHQEKMNVKYLGWFDSGITFNIWSVDEPKLDAEGNLDISDWKLRGNAIYNAFFTDYLDASVIDMPSTDTYSALETGLINATGWTQIGLIDFKWDEFLNWRIDPEFFSTDIGVIVNLDKWNSLGEEARTILQEVAIEHEVSSYEAMQERRDREFEQLAEGGMQSIALEGEARENFLKAARESTYNRMREQMEQHPMGVEHYDRLIELFYDPAKDQAS
ncbi:MAG: TRAP-type C4-dicarboxylate transport system, substrate-binding protein [Rhodobacteraceae bacterium HLUCCA24]|nr:MAG: TRAP-type C4-dicarboxylate transport system, substrate-binding protein [Rhodobacteraceae bacterium HLUCCA24]